MSSLSASTAGRDDLLRPADSMSQVGEVDEPGMTGPARNGSVAGSSMNGGRTAGKPSLLSSEALKELEGLWRQVMETAVEYCQVRTARKPTQVLDHF